MSSNSTNNHEPAIEPMSQEQKLSGIRGWLLIPAIGLVITPIAFVIDVIDLMGMYSEIASAGYGGIFLLHILVSIGIVIYIIFTAIHFFQKKRKAPEMYIDLMIINYMAPLALAVISWFFNADVFAGMDFVIFIIAFIIANVIWIPYFKKSKRVKATFVNSDDLGLNLKDLKPRELKAKVEAVAEPYVELVRRLMAVVYDLFLLLALLFIAASAFMVFNLLQR